MIEMAWSQLRQTLRDLGRGDSAADDDDVRFVPRHAQAFPNGAGAAPESSSPRQVSRPIAAS